MPVHHNDKYIACNYEWHCKTHKAQESICIPTTMTNGSKHIKNAIVKLIQQAIYYRNSKELHL